MSSHRLFFALWPDAATRVALQSARNALFPLAGRPVEAANLHVTLAFLGNVDAARLPALCALAGAVDAGSVTFDRLEHWQKPRVLVAGTAAVPLQLHRAVDQLWQRLDRLGFARETRPFKPHVTLVRDVRTLRPGARWTPVTWPTRRVSLVESVSAPTGVRYQPIA